MGKLFLKWGLDWLKKQFLAMTPDQIHALDAKIDAMLGIPQGSAKDQSIDAIVADIVPILQAVVKSL